MADKELDEVFFYQDYPRHVLIFLPAIRHVIKGGFLHDQRLDAA
jgi:hypothetical protein